MKKSSAKFLGVEIGSVEDIVGDDAYISYIGIKLNALGNRVFLLPDNTHTLTIYLISGIVEAYKLDADDISYVKTNWQELFNG